MESVRVRFLFTSCEVSKRTSEALWASEFYDTKQRVDKNCTKHFPWCLLCILRHLSLKSRCLQLVIGRTIFMCEKCCLQPHWLEQIFTTWLFRENVSVCVHVINDTTGTATLTLTQSNHTWCGSTTWRKTMFCISAFFFQQENESWCLSWANSWSPNGQALDNSLQWLGGREADRKAGSLCHEWCAGSGTHLPEASGGQRQREAEPRAFEQCPYCWCNLWEVNFWLGSLSNWAMTAMQ